MISRDNMSASAVDLYLDLLKHALTGALAEDNDAILGGVRSRGKKGAKYWVANRIGALSSSLGFEIARKQPYDPQMRANGRDWPARAESMIGLRRMDNIQYCVETVLRENVPGDVIETGVWRGGATILMRGILAAHGDTERLVWAADSFEGLPKPDAHRYPADTDDSHHRYTGLQVGLEQVKQNFRRYGLLDDRVRFLVGWFEDTLGRAPIERLSVLRLDGDMYSSTMQAIEVLYPKLSIGGFCIVDDYGNVPGCRRAIHDYRNAHGIDADIIDIDGFGAFWRKNA
jgi:O-methyltransferase